MRALRYPTAYFTPLLLPGLLAACDNDHYQYRAEIKIDSVVLADTITGGDSALVIFTIPAGCNRCPELETKVTHDTILCLLTLEFYYKGVPCAHGQVVDGCYATMDPAAPGDYLFVYRDTDTSRASIPVTVFYPD